MDMTSCQRSTHERLNICDAHEVDALCAELCCQRTDIYEAVAYVGDYVCCVREYLGRMRVAGCEAAARANVQEWHGGDRRDAAALA
jgi:hypothetical protein